jgi:hypothetical protein
MKTIDDARGQDHLRGHVLDRLSRPHEGEFAKAFTLITSQAHRTLKPLAFKEFSGRELTPDFIETAAREARRVIVDALPILAAAHDVSLVEVGAAGDLAATEARLAEVVSSLDPHWILIDINARRVRWRKLRDIEARHQPA